VETEVTETVAIAVMAVTEMAEIAKTVDSEGTLIIWNVLGGDIGGTELC
jgi:hypothetical protein